MLLQICNQNRSILGTDLIGTVIYHVLLFIGESLILSQSDQIAAERNIVLCHIHTDTESLKRGTPCIIFTGSYPRTDKLAVSLPGAIPSGTMEARPISPLRRKPIHFRSLCPLQRRLVSKPL